MIVLSQREMENKESPGIVRHLKFCVLALLLSLLSGCSSEPDVTVADDTVDAGSIADLRVAGRIATPEWETEVSLRTGFPVHPIGFRAGGGLISFLQGPPLTHWMFLLADSARGLAGGPINPREAGSRAPIRAPSDIVGISADGRSWYLDPTSGHVVSEDVGGYRAVIASLGARSTIQTACALDSQTIAYLDSARPDTVFVRELALPPVTRALPVPGGAVGQGVVPWEMLRFGGSPDGPCVVSNPRLRGLLVVAGSAVHTIDGFVEPLPVEVKRAAWYAPLARLFSRYSGAADSPATIGALDVTSFPGGVAVLFEGRTAEAGRLVDFYDGTGVYLTTMRLPHRALRIAASHGRLYVLRQRYEPHDDINGRVYLSSYVLPGRVRAGHAVAAQPTVIAPPGPAQGGASPVDTIAR
jgi:hypothetical protein